jgi:NAD(P)-dependent dehydrogenase (short-subunit alcohol dehydrogenase family)
MPRLDGHVALVTGSSRSIGKAIAIRFALDGADVVINGRSAEHCERTAKFIEDAAGRRPLVIVGDVTSPELRNRLVAASVERYGFIDILVNNAWSGTRINRLENKIDHMFRAAFETAFFPALQLMNAVLPMMRDRRWGRIINVASLNGVNAHLYTSDYNTAKEALRALTRSAAREWFRYGVVANILCPGARSDRLDEMWGAKAEAIVEAIGRKLPPGRLGDPEKDIAGVVSFLASDDARFLTGNTLFVDGGAHISGMQWEPVPEEDGGGVPLDQYLDPG